MMMMMILVVSLQVTGLPLGRNFYPIPIPYPQKILWVSPQDLHTHTEPQNPTYPHPQPVFSLQEAYFNLLFVTLTVGSYMMYVLCESACD